MVSSIKFTARFFSSATDSFINHKYLLLFYAKKGEEECG